MNIVMVGNGIAANSASEVIRRFNKNANVTMISKEAYPLYSPCLFPRYLSGEIRRQKVFLKTIEDYSKERINIILGQKAADIDVKSKQVFLETKSIGYDKLIIATGGKSIVPPIEGLNREGVFTLKSIEDADKIVNRVGKKVVVIGAGPIGVEAAMALRKRGCEVFSISRRWILPRAFDEEPSSILQSIIEKSGIKTLTWERVVEILGGNKAEGVTTGRLEINCDTVILALGIMPDIELAHRAGLEIGELGGIKTDRHMMTSIKDIYSCGDCVETRDIVSGKNTLSLLWHNAKQQGEVAGYNCIGVPRGYPGSKNIIGLDIFGTYAVSFGSTITASARKDNLEIIEKKHNGCYCRLLTADGILMGMQSIGKTKNIGALLATVLRKDDIKWLKEVIRTRELLSMNPWCYRVSPYMNC